MSVRLKTLTLFAMLLAVLLLLSVMTESSTQAQDRASNSAAEKAVSSSSAIQESRAETVNYWTTQRMENAKPVQISTRKASVAESASTPAPQGPPERIAPVAPGGGSPSAALSAGTQPAATTSNGYSYPYPFTRYEVFTPYTKFPYSTNGKVFFTDDGTNFVCSGTAVSSENKSVVWTAGHCVHDGGDGTYHTNWMFVPAYKDGNAPLGRWTARELWTLNGWSINGSFKYDLGAAVVNRDSLGRLLVNRVGGEGIAWNHPYPQHWTDFGYPQASPFNGNRQNVCTASYARQDNPDSVSGPSTIGIGCDMTGGSSGGGWIMNFSRNGGFVNSVNSYKYISPSEPLAMYGPYHGDGAANLYNAVRNR